MDVENQTMMAHEGMRDMDMGMATFFFFDFDTIQMFFKARSEENLEGCT